MCLRATEVLALAADGAPSAANLGPRPLLLCLAAPAVADELPVSMSRATGLRTRDLEGMAEAIHASRISVLSAEHTESSEPLPPLIDDSLSRGFGSGSFEAAVAEVLPDLAATVLLSDSDDFFVSLGIPELMIWSSRLSESA